MVTAAFNMATFKLLSDGFVGSRIRRAAQTKGVGWLVGAAFQPRFAGYRCFAVETPLP
jgi:hypothetical protein